MSAPPLAVRLSGRRPIVTESSADEPADDDAEADEDHVGLVRAPLDVTEHPADALDVLARADDAATGHRDRARWSAANGISSPSRTSLQENHAATVLVCQTRRVCARRCSRFVQHHVERRRAGIPAAPRSSISAPSGASSAQNTCVGAPRPRRRRSRLEQGFGRRLRRSGWRVASAARRRGSAGRSAPDRPLVRFATTCRRGGRRGCPRPCIRTRDLGIARHARGHLRLELAALLFQIHA